MAPDFVWDFLAEELEHTELSIHSTRMKCLCEYVKARDLALRGKLCSPTGYNNFDIVHEEETKFRWFGCRKELPFKTRYTLPDALSDRIFNVSQSGADPRKLENTRRKIQMFLHQILLSLKLYHLKCSRPASLAFDYIYVILYMKPLIRLREQFWYIVYFSSASVNESTENITKNQNNFYVFSSFIECLSNLVKI